jgi:hypothetical protein
MKDLKATDISGIKKREYLKGKINELAVNSKNKTIRDKHRRINEFKKRTNLEMT